MDQSRAPSLLEFWRHPRLATGRFAPLRISEWIGWLCLMVVLSFIAEAIGYLMLHLLGHAIPNDRFINHMASHPSWRFAALLLVAPVLEELTFRCFLTESPRAMAVGMGFFGAFLIGLLIHGLMVLAGKPFPVRDIAWHYFINLAIASPIIAVQAGVAWFFRRGLLRALRRYAAWAFWISALLFAAAHSFNFGIGFKDWLLWLTLPQLMAGLVLAYLRVQYGFAPEHRHASRLRLDIGAVCLDASRRHHDGSADETAGRRVLAAAAGDDRARAVFSVPARRDPYRAARGCSNAVS